MRDWRRRHGAVPLASAPVRAIRDSPSAPCCPSRAAAARRARPSTCAGRGTRATLDLFASVDPAALGGDAATTRAAARRGLGRAARRARRRPPASSRRLDDAADDLREYLTAPRWYQGLSGRPAAIAYFSPEFGITAALPQYSGGLGILAGDHLKTASDLGVPIIGVGLLYRHGYFAQSLSPRGLAAGALPAARPRRPAADAAARGGRHARTVDDRPARRRTLHAQIWLAQVGRVPLLLLDSDVEENDDGGPRRHRPAVRRRRRPPAAAGDAARHRRRPRHPRVLPRPPAHAEPEVFHTNEGHAGFLGLERIRELVDEQGLTFDEALEAVRAGTVFTTHTPVPAGIDRFPRELIETYFGGDNACPASRSTGSSRSAPRATPSGDPTCSTWPSWACGSPSASTASRVLHGAVSREMFGGLWPGFDTDEVPIGSITNGVHAPTWVAREVMELGRARARSAWSRRPGLGERRPRSPTADIWGIRRTLREPAGRATPGAGCARPGSSAAPPTAELGLDRRRARPRRADHRLRPPGALVQAAHPDAARPRPAHARCCSTPSGRCRSSSPARRTRPTRAASGSSRRSSGSPTTADVRHRIVFLPDYDMASASSLVQGCDVWMNNPLRPLEACGTSGMKAALNGGLNLSIRDGWWDEWFDGSNGWSIPTADGVEDPDRRDDLEAAALYELIEDHVAALFYDRADGGLPRALAGDGQAHAGLARPEGAGRPDAPRLRRDLYAPAAASAARLSADEHAGRESRGGLEAAGRQGLAGRGGRARRVRASGAGHSPQLRRRPHRPRDVGLGGLEPADVDGRGRVRPGRGDRRAASRRPTSS